MLASRSVYRRVRTAGTLPALEAILCCLCNRLADSTSGSEIDRRRGATGRAHRACSIPSPRHGAWPHCSRSHSHGLPLERAHRGELSTSRTPHCGTARLSPMGRCYSARARTRRAPRTVPARGHDPIRPLRPGPHRDSRSRHRRQLYRGLVAIAPTTGAVKALAVLTTEG